MPTIERSILVRADRADLFALTQDYRRRLEWDPFLREARLLGGAEQAAVGVRAWCVAWHGLGMETEYVTFAPPRVVAVRMTRGPSVLQSFAGSWRFEEVGSGRTRVVFRYNFRVRGRWLRPLLNRVLVVVFGQDSQRRLEALKRFVEKRRIRRGLHRCQGQ